MYFWRINNLIQELRNDAITQREYVKYLLGFIFLYLSEQTKVSNFTNSISKEALTQLFINGSLYFYLMLFLAIINIPILIWGVLYCYKMNKYKSDNRNFLQRFICLSFTLAMRYIPISLFILILTAFRIGSSKLHGNVGIELETNIMKALVFEKIVCTFITIHYYFRLGKKINAVGRQQSSELYEFYKNEILYKNPKDITLED
jgi:ABC-type sulfate transport system permease subunit